MRFFRNGGKELSEKRYLSSLIYLTAILLGLWLFYPGSLRAEDGDKKWEFQTGGAVYSSPAIGPQGTIYVGSDDGKVYALNPDGASVGGSWPFVTGGAILSSPAIGFDSTIYVGSSDKKIYAINPDGSKKWQFETGDIVSSTPAISSTGIIYVGSNDKKLYAIKSDGTSESGEWPFQAGGAISSSPVIGSTGVIYVGSEDGKVYAIKSSGKEKWEFETGGKVSSSPGIGFTDIIYVGSEDGKVYALDPEEGTAVWANPFNTGAAVSSSPAIDDDETIFVGSSNGNLYAINSDGTQKWVFSAPEAAVSSSPLIGYDGTIYVGSDDWNLYAVNSTTGAAKGGKWPFQTAGEVSSSPTIGFGGTIYVGSEDTKLYAIESSSIQLADLAWPKFHHDVRHTARNTTNQSPTSDAGQDQTVVQEETVTLDGSNSSDPDYGIPLYEWTQTEGTTVTLSDPTAVKPTFVAPGIDEDEISLTFQLEVTDNGDLTDTDTVVITVKKKKGDDKGCFIGIAAETVGY
jgi:outer membrane protein assembly factor BamB